MDKNGADVGADADADADEYIIRQLEAKKSEPAYKKFFKNPAATIRERPFRLIYISGSVALVFSFIAFLLDLHLLDIILGVFFIAVIPPALYDSYEKSRIKRIDNEFPNMLRDIALSRRTGMTIPAAISLTAKGEYGPLTEGIKWMSTLLALGMSFPDVLNRFAERYRTPLIKRSIDIIIETERIGGEISKILEAVANDAYEYQVLKEKKSSAAMPFLAVGYLAFFIFLGIILVFQIQFLPMTAAVLAEDADVNVDVDVDVDAVAVPGAPIPVTPEDIDLLEMLFFHLLIIQGFCSGLFAGKIGEGSILAGLKHSIVLVLIAYLSYAIVTVYL